jgi:hypothetical protein
MKSSKKELVMISPSMAIMELWKREISSILYFSDSEQLNLNLSLHEMRKSLKILLAILLFLKNDVEQAIYNDWKINLRNILKKFAILREPYVLLQTLNQVKSNDRCLDPSNLMEVSLILEQKYLKVLNENEPLTDFIQEYKESLVHISKELIPYIKAIDRARVKRRLSKTITKVQKLHNSLHTASSYKEYHRFRKWLKRYAVYSSTLLKSKKSNTLNKKLLDDIDKKLGKEHDLQLLRLYLNTSAQCMPHELASYLSKRVQILRKRILSEASQMPVFS